MLGGYQVKARKHLLCLLVFSIILALFAGSVLAAGIKVVPSTDRVAPGESFYVDIVAENIPAEGLGTVQFRLDVDAPGSAVSGVADLSLAGVDDVYVSSPLLISAPTATRSGLGDLFLNLYQGSNGILVMDNESLSSGSALYTYAHTNGANLPYGSGSVARFQFKVGSRVAAENIQIGLTDVMLIDGGEEYPLDSNIGATVTLRCSVAVPNLNGLSLAEAQTALTASELSVGNVYEINNQGNSKAHGVVLQQSVAAGDFAECESAIDLAINQAPEEVTGLSAADLTGDDTGKVVVTWIPSTSADTSGYRIYYGTNLVAEISGAQGESATVSNLPINSEVTLKVAAYDSFSNESDGASVNVTALDDVAPVIGFKNVSDGSYYSVPVQPQLVPNESHPDSLLSTLNGAPYDWSQISDDGIYTLEVTMTDASENTTTERITFTVDQTDPVISLSNITNGGYLNAALTPEIEVDDLSYDAQQTILTLNGQPYTSGTEIANEGEQTLVVVAKDKAGNQSSLTVSFILDLTDPAIQINNVSDGGYYSDNVTPELVVNDINLQESSVTLNGENYISGTPLTAEGNYELVVTALDKANNQSTETINFTIDRTTPNIVISLPEEGGFYNAELTPQIDISDLNLNDNATVLMLNDMPYVAGSVINGEGESTLVVTANDLAGNQVSQTVHFTIDTTDPTITFEGVVDEAYYKAAVTPQINIADTNLATSTITLNDNPYVSGTIIDTEGVYELVVTAIDAAGNEVKQSVDFTVDLTAPVINVANVDADAYYKTDVTPLIEFVDVSLDNSSLSLNGAPYVSGTQVTEEGVYTLVATASDLAGNQSELSTTFTIDKTAPVVSVTDVTEGTFYKGSVTPVISATDTYLEGTVATLNNVAYTPGTAISEEAVYELSVAATDLAGNSTIQTVNFTIDLTAPEIGIADVADGAFYNSDVVPVISISDVYLSESTTTLNGSPYESGMLIAEEGTYTLAVMATDHAGNKSAKSIDFVVDLTAPVVSIADVENGGYYDGEVTPTITATDTYLKTWPTTLNGENYEPGTPISEEGVYTLAVTAIDEASNETSQAIEFTIDQTAPVISVTDVTEGAFYNRDVVPSISVTDTYLDESIVTLNGESYLPGTPITTEGSYTLTITATDHAGNESTQSIDFVIDLTAPVVTVTHPIENSFFNTDVKPEYTVTDQYLNENLTISTLNGQTYVAETTVSAEGVYELTVTAQDKAGNSSSASVNFTIDLTAPIVTINNPADSSFANADVLPDYTVADTYLDETLTVATINNEPYSVNTQVSVEGDYSFSVSAEDKAGNKASSTVSFSIDLTAPEISLSDVADGGFYNGDVVPLIVSTDAHLAEQVVTLNNESYEPGTPVTEEGAYTLVVTATDEAGNEITQTVTFTIDLTAPAISITHPGNGSFANADVIPEFTVTDTYLDESLTSTTLNGLAYVSQTVVANEGDYTFVVAAEDRAGNRSTETVNFTIDKTAPIIEVTGIADGDFVNTDVVPVVIVTDTHLADSTLQLNDAQFVSGTTVSAENAYTLVAGAEDEAGNTTEVILTFTIDKTAPISSLDLGAPQYQSETALYIAGETSVSLASVDNGAAPSGIAGVAYGLDGVTPLTAYEETFDFSTLSEGEHTLVYRSVDTAGNVETDNQLDLAVDNSTPLTTISLNGAQYDFNENLFVASATSFTLEATDRFSGVAVTEYRIDEGDWTDYAPFTSSSEGLHTIEYRSTDNLGHVESVNTLAVTVDDTAPVTSISVGEPQYQTENNLFITSATMMTLAATDAVSGVAVTEYRINGGEWISYEPFNIQIDGQSLIEYRSRDKVGNLEETRSLQVVVENVPPVTDIVVGQPQYTDEKGLFVTSGTEFIVSADDAQSGVSLIEYRLDENNWTEFAPFTIEAEGDHVIAYRSVDNLGNVAEVQSLAVTVDNTAPASTIEIGQPKIQTDETLYITGVAGIIISATDNLAGIGAIEYRFDGGEWQSYAPTLTVETLDDGQHKVEYRAVDNVGNVEEAQGLTVVVDNSAPETTLDANGAQFTSEDGTFYANATTMFNMVATDEYSGVSSTEYRIDEGTWLVYEPFALNDEGEHRIEYRSRDSLGNLEGTKLQIVVIDSTPPETSAATGSPQFSDDNALYITGATEIALSSYDSSSGAAAIEYRFDGGDWQDYAAAFALTGLADGEHTVGYRSEDNLGNLESEDILAVVVDNTAPGSELIAGLPQYVDADTNLYVAGSTPFSITVTDQLSGVATTEYRLDAGDWMPYAQFTVPEEGEYVISYRSTDNLNNAEEVHTQSITVDNTAPVTEIEVANPKYTDKSDLLYVTDTSIFTLSATDNVSGVAQTQYRVDSGEWQVYQPFAIAEDGPHQIEFRSIDQVANTEQVKSLYVIVDFEAPVTEMAVSAPLHVGAGGMTYVTSGSVFTLTAVDNWVGVANTEYRVDSGTWTPAAPFSIAEEGEHLVEYRSVDHLGTLEETKSLTVTVDNTVPTTESVFDYQSFMNGQTQLISRATGITLPAEDNLAGVATTYYRFDDESSWRTYAGSFHADNLIFGDHVLHFYSVDNVGNAEELKSTAFTLVGAEVNVELLNLPRVLVWTEDPANMKGVNAPDYTLSDVQSLIAQALNTKDAFVELVTDKDVFQSQFRSGIFNVVMVLNQDVPFNANFLRELREAVKQGQIGLMVSSWGNNVHPILQDMFGLDFVGSMSMDEDQRELYLFDSDVSEQASSVAFGRILKTRMDGGTIAGIVPAESQCNGVKEVSFNYPEPVNAGSLVTVSVYTQKGKKRTLIDEEQMVVTVLPADGVNDFTGNPIGDVIIDSVSDNGVAFTLTSPYSYLESDYLVNVKVEATDGSMSESGSVVVNPTCAANLMPGMNIGPFEVKDVSADMIKIGDDLPAVVLNDYGDGRTVFMSYNILDSALKGDSTVHAGILGNAAAYLLPEMNGVEPAGIALVETTVSFSGVGLDLLAVETLSEGLTHVPLFDLTQSPLEYRFHLEAGEEASYRYFVRFPDQIGDYVKQTGLYLELGGMTVPYDNFAHVFSVMTDSSDLLQQAMLMIDDWGDRYPESAASLNELAVTLQTIGLMTKTTSGEFDEVINAVVQAIKDVESMPFDATSLQIVLYDYLRIMQSLQTLK